MCAILHLFVESPLPSVAQLARMKRPFWSFSHSVWFYNRNNLMPSANLVSLLTPDCLWISKTEPFPLPSLKRVNPVGVSMFANGRLGNFFFGDDRCLLSFCNAYLANILDKKQHPLIWHTPHLLWWLCCSCSMVNKMHGICSEGFSCLPAGSCRIKIRLWKQITLLCPVQMTDILSG